MQFEKFTVKTREAIAEAQRLAGRLGNPEIRCGHLLAAMLDQDGSPIPSMLKSIGANPDLVLQDVARIVDGYSKVSGGTRSDLGRQCRDTFASLKKTCRKLGISFWHYLHDRISRTNDIPPLPEIVRQRASPA